jgi:prepilin-type processing-associated H-X9-DG protein
MRRANVLFCDSNEEPIECDCCDQIKPCAHIHLGITNFVWCVCKDCLNELISSFYTEKEIRRKKLKKINFGK